MVLTCWMHPLLIFSQLQENLTDMSVWDLCGGAEYLKRLNQKHLLNSLNKDYTSCEKIPG